MRFRVGFNESSKSVNADVTVEGEQGDLDVDVLQKAKDLYREASQFAQQMSMLKNR